MRNLQHLLIDTDTGVDDALAILYALHSPGVKIEAITTVAGNVEVEKCTRNVRVILDYAKIKNRPLVVQGAAKPLKLGLVTAPEVHGGDGLGNTQRPLRINNRPSLDAAVDCIRRCCDIYRKNLTIVALGPLTNIAKAITKYPRSMKSINRIVSMGGAFRVPGNTGPVAEFNYYVDPHAARLVLNSGLPVTVVPLDLTEQVIFSRDELMNVVRKYPKTLSSFIAQFTANYMRYHKDTLGFEGGYLHDPMAVAIAVDSALAKYRLARIEVETVGKLTRGMTETEFLSNNGQMSTKIAVSIDRKKFLRTFYRRVLLA